MKAMPVRTRSPDSGFTVIEALIAMAILAISAVALIAVSESQVSRIDGLETRAIAQWVAENRLAELELSGQSQVEAPETVTMLGRDWEVRLNFEETSDPDLAEVRISVVETGASNPVNVLGGFIDVAGRQP